MYQRNTSLSPQESNGEFTAQADSDGIQSDRSYVGDTTAWHGSVGANTKSRLQGNVYPLLDMQMIEIDGVSFIDTPGLRELGMIGAEEGISETFSDIAELISQCAFSDCTHGNEPGCAVRQALADGTLAPERWKMYARLERENKWNKTAKNGRMMNIAMFRRQMKQERKGRG